MVLLGFGTMSEDHRDDENAILGLCAVTGR